VTIPGELLMRTPSPQGESAPYKFDWSEFWREPARVSTFEAGPLAKSYYQQDRQMRLVQLFYNLAAELNPGGQVLDVGCGNGAGALSLLQAADRQQKSLTITAIDSAEIYPAESLSRRVCFRRGRTEQLDFTACTFELVLCCFGLEFFDVDAFLTQCSRMLQPGGRVVFLTYATESPLLSMQARYVGVYENGLRQLIDSFETDQNVDEKLVEKIRIHIAQDVPQPHFRQHLHRLVDELTLLSSPDRSSCPLDHLCFSDVQGRENAISIRMLRRWFALMQVIQHAALDVPQARQLTRRMHFAGLENSCVVPLAFQGKLLCWLFTGESSRID